MRFVEEYRDPVLARGIAAAIVRRSTRRWTIMEVCGGQTHAIVEHGLDQLLAPAVELLHGPGCPVCVTPLETLDRAAALAEDTGAIVCTFGDMLRVPGTRGDLFAVRARGGDVRVVYAPLDAAQLAERTPDRAVVFLAVGFETTAPAVATRSALGARARPRQLFPAGFPRARAARPRRDRSGTRHARAGVPRGGPCLHGDGHGRVPADRAASPSADRRDRLRAGRHPRRRRARGGATRSGRGARRDPVSPRGATRRQSGRARAARRGLRDRGSPLARDRRRARRRSRAARCVSRLRCRIRLLRLAMRPRVAEPTACQPATSCAARCGRRMPRIRTRLRADTPLGAPMVSSEGACAAYFRWRGLEETHP